MLSVLSQSSRDPEAAPEGCRTTCQPEGGLPPSARHSGFILTEQLLSTRVSVRKLTQHGLDRECRKSQQLSGTIPADPEIHHERRFASPSRRALFGLWRSIVGLWSYDDGLATVPVAKIIVD